MSRKVTLKDRIAYQMSFTLAERWKRAKDDIAFWLAKRIPKRVRMWAIVQAHIDATKPDQHPGTVSAFDLYK